MKTENAPLRKSHLHRLGVGIVYALGIFIVLLQLRSLL